MIWALGGILLLAIAFGPTLWVQWVMSVHGSERTDFPGTGSELARHLLDEFNLADVPVEVDPNGADHYDPVARAVRLSQTNFDGRSVTAVAVAAHEVGHAIQDRDRYQPLILRGRLVRTAAYADRIGSFLVMGLSVIGSFAVSPRLIIAGVVALIVLGLIEVIAHLVTLPVEYDASFSKALPILEKGGYLPEADTAAARQILTAAALTYVSAAAARILNVVRFLRVLR